LSLWLTEFYSFSTVALLLVQVGLGDRGSPAPASQQAGPSSPAPLPTVDVFIPIYSESLDILERTLVAVCAMDYPQKTVYVLDDSHREGVQTLAKEFGATYLRGPRQHGKAGNLNLALGQTDGELIAVFDTDHMPVQSFLREAVPYFQDPRMGFVQTPHHF